MAKNPTRDEMIVASEICVEVVMRCCERRLGVVLERKRQLIDVLTTDTLMSAARMIEMYGFRVFGVCTPYPSVTMINEEIGTRMLAATA